MAQRNNKNKVSKPSFLEELNRRRVLRAAISYLVIAWLVVQVISVVGPAFDLGAGFMRLSIIVLALGFPLTLIMSWFFALSTRGIELESEAVEVSHTGYGRNLDFAIIGVLVAALLASLYYNSTQEPVATPLNNVLAILPLTNLSNADSDAGFVDGLHDDLLTTLSRIGALEVISRTSVMGFRDTTFSIPDIGDKLGADKIIEGSVQRAGNMIRVNVQLIDARTDKHLWANIYERPFNVEQIFSVQSDIARSVAAELKAALSLEEDHELSRVPTNNTEAYRLYLLGKQRIEERTSQSLQQAVDYLQQALALDSKYAEAHAALALAYNLQFNYSGMQKDDMLRSAMPAVQRALQLNELLPEAHTVLADLRGLQGDRQGAEEAYQRALELNPNSALAHHWYGIMLLDAGRYEEALAQHQKAQQLDPLSSIISVNVAQDLSYLGRREEALIEYERALEIDPEFIPAYAHMAALYNYSLARPDESVRWLHKAYEKDPGHTEYPSQLAESLLDLGMADAAGVWADRAYAIGPTQYWPLRAKLLHAIFSDNVEEIELYSNEMLTRIPSQYYSLAQQSRALAAAGDTDTARQLFVSPTPQLFESPPQIDNTNYPYALLLAYVERQAGNNTAAETLAQTALVAMAGEPRVGFAGIEVFDAEAHALLGSHETAIDVIEQAIKDDWSHNWWMMRSNPVFDPLREHPRYLKAVSKLDAKMQALRAELTLADYNLPSEQ